MMTMTIYSWLTGWWGCACYCFVVFACLCLVTAFFCVLFEVVACVLHYLCHALPCGCLYYCIMLLFDALFVMGIRLFHGAIVEGVLLCFVSIYLPVINLIL
jgi:hypothetical protein